MKPVYEAAFKTAREIGDVMKDALGVATPYEALLDQFNPGLKLATVEREFARLEEALPGMIAEAAERQKSAARPCRCPELRSSVLNKIGAQLMLDLGFDESRGVLHVGDMHPIERWHPRRFTPDHALQSGEAAGWPLRRRPRDRP